MTEFVKNCKKDFKIDFLNRSKFEMHPFPKFS